jgi:hypothetical protein
LLVFRTGAVDGVCDGAIEGNTAGSFDGATDGAGVLPDDPNPLGRSEVLELLPLEPLLLLDPLPLLDPPDFDGDGDFDGAFVTLKEVDLTSLSTSPVANASALM